MTRSRRWIVLLLVAAAVAVAVMRGARPGGAGAEPRGMAPDSAAADAPGAARDLAADEARGGHTLERHVGRSDGELVRRLTDERGISAASSFTDRATAERVVAAALAREAPRIERWLASGSGNLALDYRGAPGEVVGRTLERGERAPRPTGAARIVLRKKGGRFFVLTAYPVGSGGRA